MYHRLVWLSGLNKVASMNINCPVTVLSVCVAWISLPRELQHF